MDIQYLLALQSFRQVTRGVFDSMFLFLTQFGEVAIPLTVALIFYYAADKKLGQFMLLGYAGALYVNGIIKLTACVYRPWIRDARILPAGDAKVTATGYSFPSGHSSLATSIYGSAAAYYRKRTGLCISFLILLALVMFSRNYLGVHTPQDVVVGFCATAVVLFILYKVIEWCEGGKQRDIVLFCGIVVLSVAAIVYFLLKPYPIDYTADGKMIVDPKAMIPDSFFSVGSFIGAFFGWVIERRCINFTNEVETETKVLRCLSGFLVLLMLRYVLSPFVVLVCGYQWGLFICAFVTMFYLVAGHPFIFTAIEKRRGIQLMNE